MNIARHKESTSLKGEHLCDKHFFFFLQSTKSSEMTNFKKEVCKNNNKLILNEFIIFFLWLLKHMKQSHIFLEVLPCLFLASRFLCNAHCVSRMFSVNLTSFTSEDSRQSAKAWHIRVANSNWVIPKDKFWVWRKQIRLTLWPFCTHEVL